MRRQQILYRKCTDGIEYFPKQVPENMIELEMICRCCLKKSKTSVVYGTTIVKCPKCGVGHQMSDFKE